MPRTYPPAIERVLARVVVNDAGCWLFTGATSRDGYGVVGLGGGRAAGVDYCHRVVYRAVVMPIPDGYQIDHLCRVRACCNPEHLEAVPQSVNLQREAESKPKRTHCANGHPFTPENTAVTGRQRRCVTCHRARCRAYYLSRKDDVA